MPPRPFPLPFSIGTDICHIPRIRALCFRSFESRSRGFLLAFLRRLFTAREQDIFWRRFGGMRRTGLDDRETVVKHLAGRFAAKEAVMKAVKWRRLMFDEIQILPDDGDKGVHALILDGRATTKDLSPKQREALKRIREARQRKMDGAHISGEQQVGPRAAMDTTKPIDNEQIMGTRSGDDTLADNEDMNDYPEVDWLADDGSSRESDVSLAEYEDPPGQIARISISHDGEHATAVCIAVEEPIVGDVDGEAAARCPS